MIASNNNDCDKKEKKEPEKESKKGTRKRKQRIPISKTFKTYGEGEYRRFSVFFKKKSGHTAEYRDLYTQLSKNILPSLHVIAKDLNISYSGRRKADLIQSIEPYIHFE